MLHNIISMSDGDSLSFEECLDNLQNTRDYSLYLKTLSALKERYLIILSIKDTPAKISDSVLKLVKEIGFSNLTNEMHRTYIGIIDRGNVIYNLSADAAKIPMETETVISDTEICVVSEPKGSGNSKIIINGVDYSMNGRGLNIVVYDFETKSVVDSSTYDCYTDNPQFYHKLLWFDEQYINEHFFMKEKYKKQWANYYQRSMYSNRKPGYREVINGIVEPVIWSDRTGRGGCCDENFNFIAGHAKIMKNCYEVDESYIHEGEIEFIDETVIYAGNIRNHPGHIIAEHLVEYLWYIIKNDAQNYRIALTHYRTSKYANDEIFFIKELFDLCNIPFSRVIIVEKPVRFAKIIVPDPCSMNQAGSNVYEITDVYIKTVELVKSKISPANCKKIYLTRSKAKNENCVGEDYFIEFYKNKGFEIINPEDYSFKEKAALMLGADEVVSTSGTNSLFFIFCKPNVKVTILSRIRRIHSKCQSAINQCGIKNVNFVNIAAGFLDNEQLDPSNVLFFLCVTEEFRDYVRKTYNEELDITPEQSLKNNLYDYLIFFLNYYSKPAIFNRNKNQKMLTVLQQMSEVFLGQDFDTSQLNIKTNEDALNDQVKKLTKELDSAKGKVKTLESRVAEESEIKLLSANTKITNELLIANTETTNELLEKQFSDIKKLLKKKNRNQDFYEQQIEELKAAIEQKNCEQLMKQVDELKKKNKSLEKKVKVYEQSKLWKITKPLRSIAGFFRKLFGKG